MLHRPGCKYSEMYLTVRHIPGHEKRPLSRLNVKTDYCFHLALRMYPSEHAYEILPLAQRLRKHISFCTPNRRKQIHLNYSFLLYFSLVSGILSAVLGQYFWPTWESAWASYIACLMGACTSPASHAVRIRLSKALINQRF